MADMVTEVGNKPVNHAAANTLPFEEAVSCATGAGSVVSRDRGWAGGGGGRENDSSTSFDSKSFLF